MTHKTALITGGAVRVGKAIALSLAEHGYDIALHYNSSESDANEVAAAVKAQNRQCHLFKHDLQTASASEELFNAASSQCENIALLINNASIFEPPNFLDTDEDIFDRHMDINFKVPFFLAQYFARYIQEQQTHGHIINILDTCIRENPRGYFSYMLSKKSLSEFTRMAARSLAPSIRVNAICPGTLLTSPHWDEADIARKKAALPMQDTASVEDVCQAVLSLIDAPYLTGQHLFVDGGQQLL